MSTTTRAASTARSGARRPSTVSSGIRRIGYEVRAYFRQRDGLIFTFLFPLILLLIFSVAFSEAEFGRDSSGEVITAAWFYLPAMLAAGLLLSGLQNLAIDIAIEKSDGTLKRLSGAPLSVTSYFIGKIGQVLITGALQAVLLILVATLAFGVPLPEGSERWWTLAWVFLLGVITSAVLGIALSAMPRSGKTASAVVIPIVLLLQFISGVYLQFSMLPEWLQNVASVFPLKWMAQGMRYVFLPDEYQALEPGGAWNLEGIALVLALWLVLGLVFCQITFRWVRRKN